MGERLHPTYLELLISFYEMGGVGAIDPHHRLMVKGAPLRGGEPGACMLLVSKGMLGGEHNQVMLTELGRETADAELRHRQEVRAVL